MPEQLSLDGRQLHRAHVAAGVLWQRTRTGAYRRGDGRYGIRPLRVYDTTRGHKVTRWRLFARGGHGWEVVGVYASLAVAKEAVRCIEAASTP